MPDSGAHCPFLNRADARCAGYLSLDRLRHSYNFCFGSYASCAVYTQLLAERRVRRGELLIAGTEAAPLPLMQVSVARVTGTPPAKQPATRRWTLWQQVRRGIVAGVHLRLTGSDRHDDAPTTPRPAYARASASRPSASRAAAAASAPTAVASPPGLRARAG